MDHILPIHLLVAIILLIGIDLLNILILKLTIDRLVITIVLLVITIDLNSPMIAIIILVVIIAIAIINMDKVLKNLLDNLQILLLLGIHLSITPDQFDLMLPLIFKVLTILVILLGEVIVLQFTIIVFIVQLI